MISVYVKFILHKSNVNTKFLVSLARRYIEWFGTFHQLSLSVKFVGPSIKKMQYRCNSKKTEVLTRYRQILCRDNIIRDTSMLSSAASRCYRGFRYTPSFVTLSQIF